MRFVGGRGRVIEVVIVVCGGGGGLDEDEDEDEEQQQQGIFVQEFVSSLKAHCWGLEFGVYGHGSWFRV